ncbi:MAG: hypothetical protein DYH03_00150 [Nitrospira sp. NTP1]|jgi:DNA-directed RNA polymerase specialized sigma24 family protein|nr:hypothetical protein [Nitrospira sp. NTP1]
MSFRTQAQQLAIDSDDTSPLLKLFQQSKPIIHSIAKRYCNLDRSYEIEDLEQIGFLAVRKATEKWDFSRGNAQFQTFLYRYIQKAYQSEFDGRDKLVEITDKDDQYVKTLPYSTFIKEKRRLHSQGFKSRIFRRLVPLATHEPTVSPDALPESMGLPDLPNTDEVLAFTAIDRFIEFSRKRARTIPQPTALDHNLLTESEQTITRFSPDSGSSVRHARKRRNYAN